MKLTIWKKTEKDRDCLLKIDDSVWGALPEKALRTLFQFRTGSFDITEAQAGVLQDELTRVAWNRLLDWLARQERSTLESREYLKNRQFHSSIIGVCIDKAVSQNYINDKRYCRLLIESLLARRLSRFRIRGKLLEKRLPAPLWEQILDEIVPPAEEKSSLLAQAEKAYHRFRHLDKKACYEKCLAALYRKGFDLEEARETVAGLVYRR